MILDKEQIAVINRIIRHDSSNENTIKFFRERYDICVSVSPTTDDIKSQWRYEIFVCVNGEWQDKDGVSGYNSYEEAQKAAINFLITVK